MEDDEGRKLILWEPARKHGWEELFERQSDSMSFAPIGRPKRADCPGSWRKRSLPTNTVSKEESLPSENFRSRLTVSVTEP